MTDLSKTKGMLTVSIGEGYISSFEASTLKKGDVVRTANLAGYPSTILFNGAPIGRAEVVIAGDIFGVRVVMSAARRASTGASPGSGDDLIELLPTTVSLGSIRLSLAELQGAGHQSIISLGKPFGAEEDAELLVAGVPVARGKVVVIQEEMGIRITEVHGKGLKGLEEGSIRASGFILDPDDAMARAKSYDFKRPDKFTYNSIMKLAEIHGYFLKNLQARIPDVSAALAQGRQALIVDQCTFGEATSALPPAEFGCLIAENEPWSRPVREERAAQPERRIPAGKVLIEEEGTAHPVPPKARAYFQKLAAEAEARGGSPVLLYFRRNGPLDKLISADSARESIFSCLRGGWKNVVDLNLRPAAIGGGREELPVISEDEMVIIVSVKGRTDDKPAFGLVYPYLTLEPYIGILG